jgi:hypothetical protein
MMNNNLTALTNRTSPKSPLNMNIQTFKGRFVKTSSISGHEP